ncbi:MAG: WD40 repeat domain-containing protein, partial [Chitinophagaceae bacterium]
HIKILVADSGQLITALQNSTGSNAASFSSDGETIVTATDDQSVKIWNARTGMLLRTLIGHRGKVLSARFSPDDSKIFSIAVDSTIKVWDVMTGTVLKTIAFNVEHNCIIKFSPDGNKIVVGAGENVMVLDAHDYRELLRFSVGEQKSIRDVSFESDLIIASGESQMFFFSMASGKFRNSVLIVDSTDYFVQIPEGYFLSTPRAAKLLHYVTRDLKLITFEQLDVKYNRPDKVLEAIGNTDTALIKSYLKAWEKRIKKLGIDTTAFREGYSVPECDFVNRDAIE